MLMWLFGLWIAWGGVVCGILGLIGFNEYRAKALAERQAKEVASEILYAHYDAHAVDSFLHDWQRKHDHVAVVNGFAIGALATFGAGLTALGIRLMCL